MKILFASSEAQPLIKTGGLADVSGSLPAALKARGEDVRLILPAYRGVPTKAGTLEEVARLDLPAARSPVRILRGQVPDSAVPLYLVDASSYFDRPGGPYTGPDGHDWPDNAARFALFSRAVCQLALNQAGLDWQPDVVHCNDWQTGLVPSLLAMETRRPATIFTIHNLAYQGVFDWRTFEDLELPYELWSMHALEFYGQMSFIKGGLSFADRINTVSPTYAEEIRTPEFGCGLEGLLTHRAGQLSGILNGVEYEAWNPETDRLIPARFSSTDPSGKADNKRALQAHFGLEERVELPMLGMVGRLVEQKGVDLVLAILDRLMDMPLQLVILGTGQHKLEVALRGAAKNYPHLGVEIGYDEKLAHLIEAGSDLFIMPSRFEPCGLNQMYSLRYGTLPVVRRTGGLADTVVDADARALADGRATGFVFDEATPAALLEAIERALALHGDAAGWRRVMTTAMRQDFSWDLSAGSYLSLYRDAMTGV